MADDSLLTDGLWRISQSGIASAGFRELSLADFGSDHFPGNNDFHTAVSLAALIGGVVCNGISLAEAYCGHHVLGEPLLDDKIAHRIRTLLRKLHIGFVPAYVIGMTLDG